MPAHVLRLLIALAALLLIEGYDKHYSVSRGVRLEGCLSHAVENIISPVICTQLCVSRSWQCQSLNYNSVTQKCELNWCLESSDFSIASMVDDAQSTHYKVEGISANDCEMNHGWGMGSCHPDGTASCSPSSYSADGKPIARVCHCHTFAFGDDCSLVSPTTEEGVGLQLKPAATLATAKSVCAGLSGHVFTTDSHVEVNHAKMFLQRENGSPTDILIGLEYYDVYADFAYSSNMQPLTGYTHWLSSLISPSQRDDCVKLSSSDDYKWVDVDCSTELPYICEVPTCETSFRAYNGSCYHFDSGARNWAAQNDYCYQKSYDSRLAWITYEEENSYMIGVFNSEWGAGYPIVNGLSDQMEDQTFRWVHNEWISLDWNVKWKHLGCYNDNPHQFDSIEGTYTLLTDNAQSRSDPITKCYYATKILHNQVFGVQYGGSCRSSATAHEDYANLGTASGCSDGEGGDWMNDIYEVPNHNLYHSFGFHSTSWNDGTHVFFWWHGDNWYWHDHTVSQAARAVCKKENCPQGFAPHANKCFKILTAKQTREEARDECQRYTGADLYNPEYPDEEVFLSELILQAGIDDVNGFYWNGVYDADEDGQWVYEVMKKSVVDNYNIYPIGAEPIYREGLDGATATTQVEMRWKIPANGKIVGWEYYSGRAGTSLKFSILRPERELVAGDCQFYVVGVNYYTSGLDYNRIDVPAADQISVQAGDYVAMTFPSGSNVRYIGGYSPENICFTHTSDRMVTTAGTSVNLERGTYLRVYSFRGLFRPDPASVPDESPFMLGDSATFNGGQCFYGYYNGGMKVRDLDCSTSTSSMAICEIKKRNRHSPDEAIHS